MISKELEAEVLRLFYAERWLVGTIATQLGIHHTTVQRVLNQAGVEPRVIAPRPSIADPYLSFIVEQLEKFPRLCSSRLYAMVKDRGYPGGPDHFRRIVGRHRPRKPAEAYQRLKTLPGEQAQVDWAHFGRVEIGRATRVLWAFVMVLSWSRQVFLRFFLGSSMPFFIRGHVDAFGAFQGVPRVLLYDNLKSAVLERRGDAVRFNPRLLELAAHYHFEPRPVAVARGNEKGRVERVIRYVRDGFFAARKWRDVDDLNRQADEWCHGLAAERRWAEDHDRTVAEVFAEEKGKMLSLPQDPFPSEEVVEVAVGKTPYVRFDLNDYSVPHERVRTTLVVRASLDQLRILDGNDVVATHARSWDRGQQIEDAEHLRGLAQHKRQARQHRGLDRLAKAAPSTESFMTRIAERGGNIGSTTARLLDLLDRSSAVDLEAALVEAIAHDRIHLGAVRQIVDRLRGERGRPPLTTGVRPERHAGLVVRPHALGNYDGLGVADKEADDD
jgi:transposase